MQVLHDLHVAAPFARAGVTARAGGDDVFRADLVPSCAEHRCEHLDHPVVRLGGT